jgi:cell division protease FtsH
MAESASSEPIACPALLEGLRAHFGQEPSRLPVLEQQFAGYERPNLHLALQEMLAEPKRSGELLGIVTVEEHGEMNLARLTREQSARRFDIGPVEYIDVDMPGNTHLACVKSGLYLIRDNDQPIAVLFNKPAYSWQDVLKIEVMGTDREVAERFLRQLTRMTRHGNAYRGHVLSIQPDCQGGVTIQFHQLPKIDRNEIILPEALLARIERQTMSFSRHAERLRAAGRHLKRGILMHGPPGTGKTLSAMYLVSQMPGRTVVLLTGGGMGSIETACKLARLLTPATIILEDVDLIGTERGHQTVGANALLFELLNQMDGLADDADILFVLTTNRPDILEPALASRPGRIDQAIEIPPPDADCRRRLFDLYGRGLQMQVTEMNRLVERTNGVSAAFIRELLRKAAVFAAEDDEAAQLIVRDRHIEEALTELLVAGGPLTQSLLGANAAMS